MNIGIDIRCLMQRERTGVGEYAFNLLDNLFKIDSQNQYFLFYNSHAPVEQNLPKWNYPNVKFCGFKYSNKLLNFGFRFLGWPKINKMIEKKLSIVPLRGISRSEKNCPPAGGLDIFFMPDYNFFALGGGVRLFLTVHDLSLEIYPEFYSFKKRLWGKFLAKKKILKQARKIIAVSENTRKDLVDYYKTSSEKVEVIPLASAIASCHCEETEGRRSNLNNPPENYFLFVGSIEPRKNVESIILALNQVKNVDLILVGPKGYRANKVFRLIESLGLKNRVKYLSYLNPKEKKILYQEALALVYQSYYEGFGLPLLEAASCGCPIITAANSAIGETIGQTALLVNPYSVDELILAMRQIKEDHQLREKLIAMGYQQTKNFSWQKTAEETLEIVTSNE